MNPQDMSKAADVRGRLEQKQTGGTVADLGLTVAAKVKPKALGEFKQ